MANSRIGFCAKSLVQEPRALDLGPPDPNPSSCLVLWDFLAYLLSVTSTLVEGS